MLYKFQYQDEADKERLIGENKDKILIEQNVYFDGNFLVFSDVKRLEESVNDIKNNMDILLLKQEGIL